MQTHHEGDEIQGHRLMEDLKDGSWRTLRLSDRRVGRLYLLDLSKEVPPLPLPDRGGPGLLPLMGSGRLDGRTGFAVLEGAFGDTLDDLLEEGALPTSRAIRLLRRLAETLQLLEDRDIVLHDLRPSDIRIHSVWDGDQVQIPPHPVLVGPAVGRRLGGYAAPEIAFSPLDARATQYTLGVLAFEICCGTAPHNPEAPPGERTLMSLHPLADVPPLMDAFIERLMQDDRDNRFPDWSAVLQALEEMDDTGSTIGHFTPVIRQRDVRPMDTRTFDLEAEETVDPEVDSAMGILLFMFAVCVVAMLLSWVVFLAW